MIVLRVQHIQGHGPFSGKPFASDLHKLVAHLGVPHPGNGPSPWEDFAEFRWMYYHPHADRIKRLSGFRFGCISLEQIRWWFELDMLAVLQQHGYRLFHYRIADSLIYFGENQVAFPIHMAKKEKVDACYRW